MLLGDMIFVICICLISLGTIFYSFYDMFKQFKKLRDIEKERCITEEREEKSLFLFI